MSVSRLYAVSGFLPPLDRRSSRDAVALTLSITLHVAIGALLIHYGFLAFETPAEPKDEITIQTDMPRWIPKPADTPKPKTQTIPVRVPEPTAYPPPEKLDAAPSDTPLAPDPGPLTLPQAPTGPVGPISEGRGGTGPAGPPANPPAPPRPTVITSPRWLRQPNPDQMQRAYPVRAAEAGIGGQATINCRVIAGGQVNDCQVVSQTPSGEGFGPAAIQLSRYFLLDPRTENGQAVNGARVTIPLRFLPPTG